MTTTTRPLLVGELNPTGRGDRYAMYPRPAHRAGGRLAAILGMTAGEYLLTFDRVNLCAGAWDLAAARRKAALLDHPTRVLLGARVARAHGVAFRPHRRGAVHPGHEDRGRAVGNVGSVWCGRACFDYLVLPHPSGRCRIWNDPREAARARRALRAFLAAAGGAP